jgi:hypothetical protein
MYSKAEMQQLKREFWIAFAEAYPNKWLLYDTKIKDASLKFDLDNKKIQVMLSLEQQVDEKRYAYFDNLLALRSILEDYLPEVVYSRQYFLENGKEVSRIWVEKTDLNMGNRKQWPEIFDFFAKNMTLLETFFEEYKDIIEKLPGSNPEG